MMIGIFQSHLAKYSMQRCQSATKHKPRQHFWEIVIHVSQSTTSLMQQTLQLHHIQIIKYYY